MPGAASRRGRQIVAAVLVVLVAVGGAIALLVFFASRDTAPVTHTATTGPGQAFADLGARHISPSQRTGVHYNSNPPTSGPHVAQPIRRDAKVLTDDQILNALEAGDVVLAYGSPVPPPGLRALAADLTGGPFEPAVAEAGQAVILARRPGIRGIVAVAWRHLARYPAASDPELRRFADFWLGRGNR